MVDQNMSLRYRNIILLVVCSCFFYAGSAQTNDSTSIKSHPTYFSDQLHDFYQVHPASIVTSARTSSSNHSIMLSAPSMGNSYPLFCRLEDKINEGNKIKCLFRLGSVSYVNYLEQKGDHQRLLLEQLR